MKQLKDLMLDVAFNGQERRTRSGDVLGVFRRDFVHDMREGLPFPMTKKLAFKAMIGELLWFMSGKCDLKSLRKFSGLSDDAWTIWTNDYKRWIPDGNNEESLGKLYGHQWRNYGGTDTTKGTDQLANLIFHMMNSETSRYLIVNAYNPKDISEGEVALPPCHMGFQVYIDVVTGEFDLDWTQRSVDVFLGLPFNIASYGVLMTILGHMTGLKPRFLYGSLKDTHIYKNHLPAVYTQLKREVRPCTAKLTLPEILSLQDICNLTADDFKLENYNPDPAIKAPLSVG